MKIAQVVCAWPPAGGGIGNSAYRIANLLGEKHQVENFTPDSLTPWLRYGKGAFLPQLLWRLPSFDYIYLHYPFFGTAEVIWLFKIFFGRPKLLIHYHMDVKASGIFTWLLSFPERLIRKSLFKKAELITVASLDYIKSSAIHKYYEARPEKFREIPFAIDTERYQPKLLDRPAKNGLIAKSQEIVRFINDKFLKKSFDLLFVGGLDRAHYFKGIPVLLKALALGGQKEWRLKIVGDGDRRPDYESLAEKYGISDQVEFVGQISDPDLIRAYQASDVLVLPSINTNEAFGIVLIEAMACGVPVIASDLPGVRRVFDNFQEGLLFEPANAEDLFKKLEFLSKNEELRRQMAKAARNLAEKKYSLTAVREKLENLFSLI